MPAAWQLASSIPAYNASLVLASAIRAGYLSRQQFLSHPRRLHAHQPLVQPLVAHAERYRFPCLDYHHRLGGAFNPLVQGSLFGRILNRPNFQSLQRHHSEGLLWRRCHCSALLFKNATPQFVSTSSWLRKKCWIWHCSRLLEAIAFYRISKTVFRHASICLRRASASTPIVRKTSG